MARFRPFPDRSMRWGQLDMTIALKNSDPQQGSGGSRRRLRRLLALVVGIAVATAIFFLRRTGVLDGVPAVVFAVLLVLILPCSTILSRRVLLGGAIFLGWMPVLWWVRLPVPEVDRVGIVLALVSGALACWVLWSPEMGARARRLVPRAGIVDAMPVAAAGIATWTVWPFITFSGADRLLNALYYGWDHVSHFGMVMQIRSQGAIVSMLGSAPDGSQWQLASYPQHFHATTTALTELHHGSVVRDAATEVLLYGRSVALLQVLTTALLAAGVAQLPGLRRRPLFAWPLGSLVVAAFLFGNGNWALARGYGNFVLACATVGLAALLAAPMLDELKPLRVFALGGLVVATVHGWVLLAPVAMVAGAVAFVPLRSARWPQTRGGRASLIAALTVTLAASAAVIPILAKASVEILSIVNDSLDTGRELSTLILTCGLALAVAVAAYVRRETPESAMKGVGLAVIAVTGLLSLGLVVVYQYATIGRVSYYFDKLVVGIGLISVPVLAAGLGMLLEPPPSPRSRLRGCLAVVASALAALAALQLFTAAGVAYRSGAKELMRVPPPADQRVFQAAALSESMPFGSTVYIAAMPGDGGPVLTYYWQVALSKMWTVDANSVAGVLARYPASESLTAERAAEAAQVLLEADRRRTIIVAPEIVDSIRAAMPAELRGRVITWGSM
jgi:hypothetical protein